MLSHLATAWCAHPRLKGGEAFSAWLHRCAQANGVVDHTFTGHLFPGAHVWTRDADRLADGEMCAAAAQAMSEHVPRVQRATLQRFEGKVFATLSHNGWLPWVTPVGVFHRRRRHPGWAFCPACLRESGTSYLRHRLAWSVICPRHTCWLLDRCPRCQTPFEFHRIGLTWQGQWRCPTCGRNLAASVPHEPLDTRALAGQHRLFGILRYHRLELGSWVIPPLDAFTGIRRLLPALWPASGTAGLVDGWPRPARRQLDLRRCDGPFEYWPIRDRAKVLSAMEVYLRDWPERLVHDARRAHMRGSRLDAVVVQSSPTWLAESWAMLCHSIRP